jgi:hypothetical protein
LQKWKQHLLRRAEKTGKKKALFQISGFQDGQDIFGEFSPKNAI